jgi:hypothetical protein
LASLASLAAWQAWQIGRLADWQIGRLADWHDYINDQEHEATTFGLRAIN